MEDMKSCGLIRFFIVLGLIYFWGFGLMNFANNTASPSGLVLAIFSLFCLILAVPIARSAEKIKIAKKNKKIKSPFSEKVMAKYDSLKKEVGSALEPIPQGDFLPHKIKSPVTFVRKSLD